MSLYFFFSGNLGLSRTVYPLIHTFHFAMWRNNTLTPTHTPQPCSQIPPVLSLCCVLIFVPQSHQNGQWKEPWGETRGHDLLWTNDSAKNIACCQICVTFFFYFPQYCFRRVWPFFKNTLYVGIFFFVMGYLTLRQCSFLKWHVFSL